MINAIVGLPAAASAASPFSCGVPDLLQATTTTRQAIAGNDRIKFLIRHSARLRQHVLKVDILYRSIRANENK
jgi:hypothetical protein